MPKKTRETFSPEFKREAVTLLKKGHKEASQLARELGVRRNQLYKWKDEVETYGDNAFPGQGRRSAPKDETTQLKAELKKLREENEILKKAAIYFAKESP